MFVFSNVIKPQGLEPLQFPTKFRSHSSESLTLDTMLTLLWIVGITNAFNLLDNMDGLCTGVALIAGSALLVLFVSAYGNSAEAVYLAVLLGAAAGFLVYNFHPASVFLGDSGSMLLGLSVAVLALGRGNGLEPAQDMVSAIAAPALVLLIPIFDTTLVTVSRMRSGRSPAQGGTDHSSHRLVAIGLSQPAAVAVLWTLAALGALLGVTIQRLDANETVVVVSVFLIAVVMFALYLGRARVYEDADPALVRAGKMTLLFNDFPYKRRVVEILWDLGLVSVAYYSAYRLRFDSEAFIDFFPSFLQSLPLVLGLQVLTLAAAGGYSRVRRDSRFMDGVTLATGVLLGTLGIVGSVAYLYHFETYSRGVFAIYAPLLIVMLIASRASFRLIDGLIQRRQRVGTAVLPVAGPVRESAATRQPSTGSLISPQQQ